MRQFSKILIPSLLSAILTIPVLCHGKVVFRAGHAIEYSLECDSSGIVKSALALFSGDAKTVLGSDMRPVTAEDAELVIQTVAQNSADVGLKPQGFRIQEKDGKLYVEGADSYGTAYGIMELSRRIGVSPWEWWADSQPAKLDKWTVKSGFMTEQSPAVEYRGIFINDEDNGFCPWSWKTNDKSDIKGRIGPKTHEKVFQLMLRLRANVFWPAMHSCSVPFYQTEGNREMADRYGIIIGTSHCEPMLRNTNGEWKKRDRGEYNYITNRKGVLQFWEERVKETAHSGGIYTLGMRGIHDTGMEGVNTLDEQLKALQQVIDDQRQLISKYVDSNPAKVPQVFIPYKEVLPVYHAGLNVPDDVMLMWCDDNYGYIRHIPTAAELERSGGNGLYYHFSYWGRPQTHVWLPSTSPALVQEELLRAYEGGIRKMWIFNVGDIKPNEFLTEYGLEMAWDENVLRDRNPAVFMRRWLSREFGEKLAASLLPVMMEYYDLSYRRRAEMLGNTRVEEKDSRYKNASDLPWTDEEAEAFLKRASAMEDRVMEMADNVPEDKKNVYFELIEYPCCSYAAMARKMICAQLARHGKMAWSASQEGHRQIYSLTESYHSMLGGKWDGLMGFWKRHSMFKEIDSTKTCLPVLKDRVTVCVLNASDGNKGNNSFVTEWLGYSRQAISIAEGDEFTAAVPASSDSLYVTLAFVPLHPVDTGSIEVGITVGDGDMQRIAYNTQGRSEEWKQNIERNQALRTIVLAPSEKKRIIKVKALTPAVILDEIRVEKII